MSYNNSSAGRTIISPLVAKDRVITKFPQAFHGDATPYQKMNFHAKVKTACSQNKTGTVGLKICKAVIVGDVAVGKTCLVNRFCHNVFDREYKATIGVDFEVEKFSILSVPFNLQIWDTAGQERFKCIAASYYRGANVVIVTFDLSDIETLRHARKWKEDACESAMDPFVFLVGPGGLRREQQSRLITQSESSYLDMESKAIEVATEIGAEYWSVSSLSGENVRDFFFRAVSLTFDRQVMNEVDSVNSSSTKQIGSELIKVRDRPGDLYEKSSSKKPKCCT